MEGRKRFLMLTLGVFLVICNIQATKLNIYGPDPKNPYKDMTLKLEKAKAEKKLLEELLAKTTDANKRAKLEKELEQKICAIGKMEVTYRVVYRHHLEVMAEISDHFTDEKEKLLREFGEAENQHAQAVAELEAANQEERQNMEMYQKQVDEWAKEMNRIIEEYAAQIESQYQQQEKLKQENRQLAQEREETKQKLKEAQDLHSKALDAMSVTTQEGYRPVGIPYQDAINELGHDTRMLTGKNQGRRMMLELLTTQAKLESLLQKLYQESDISNVTPHEDLEDELVRTEMESLRTRDEKNDQRRKRLDEIKNKGLVDYNEDEITLLHEANQEVVETDKVLQEVARRSAYLKGISQVMDLIKQCSNALSDVLGSGMSLRRSKHPPNITPPTKGLQDVTSLSDGSQRIIKAPDSPTQVSPSPQEERDVKQDATLNSYEDHTSVLSTIHEKILLYRDLQELYNTRVRTEIVKALTMVKKRLPLPLPGCQSSALVGVRHRVVKWVNEVQYALRLSKQLREGDDRSMIAQFFLGFLENLRDALYTFAGGKISQETDVQDDDEEITRSVETFEMQEMENGFERNFEYVNTHLRLLDFDAERREEQLKTFRYNLIFVKKASDVVEDEIEEILTELRDNQIEGDLARQEFETFLKEMDIAQMRLSQLFDAIISNVRCAIEKVEREYQSALEEYSACRTDNTQYAGKASMKTPAFGNIPQRTEHVTVNVSVAKKERPRVPLRPKTPIVMRPII